jgi:hypothetical protein
MSRRGLVFVQAWIAANVTAQSYAARFGHARPKVMAERCAADAAVQGISVSEIEEEVGDLEVRMSDAINMLR